MAEASLPGLSLAPGLSIQHEVWRKLGLPISWPTLVGTSFALVVAFGSCKFRLSDDSVGLILQASIEGTASHFRVSRLADRVFKFFVSSKPVGIFVRNLHSFESDLFKLTFHFWGHGRPNWRQELRLFYLEEESSWQHAGQGRSKLQTGVSFADAVRSNPLSGANRIPLGARPAKQPPKQSVFDRISFPKFSVFERLNPSPQGASYPAMAGPSVGQSSKQSPRCPRCLSHSHSRRDRRWPIRCLACNGLGHVAASCSASAAPPGRQRGNSFGVGVAPGNSMAQGGGRLGRYEVIPPSPPIYCSFSEMARATAPQGSWAVEKEPIHIPWRLPARSKANGPVEAQGHREDHELHDVLLNLEPSAWSLSTAATIQEENPTRQQCCSNASHHPPLPAMAYERADPAPFAPPDMPCIQVENRVPMVRAMASRRPPATNEDLAIVTIAPLPDNMLNFAVVRQVLNEFIVDVRGIAIKDIQPCHLGQAYVRFERPIDRDDFIRNGPHPYQNVHFTFTKHNEGRNWRKASFNTDCCLC